MQFKKVGNRIQVLAYRGYDNEKKRAIVKMLGSLDDSTLQLSEGLVDSMTEDEKSELQSYIEKERQDRKISIEKSAINICGSALERAADAIAKYNDAIDQNDAEQIYLAMDKMKKALRKAGFKRPEKPKKTVNQDDKTMSFWADLPDKKPD